MLERKDTTTVSRLFSKRGAWKAGILFRIESRAKTSTAANDVQYLKNPATSAERCEHFARVCYQEKKKQKKYYIFISVSLVAE